jgi:hypothetical protein
VRNIALIGKARSGKDTAASFLVRERHYTRIAFADPLKEMALSIDPLIPTGLQGAFRIHVRLSALVADVGWEYAKDTYPEVRRVLQSTGQTIREYDPDYWVNVGRRKLSAAEAWNMPVVVTDVRYINEAVMLRSRGFRLVRIVRPDQVNTSTHVSETELDTYSTDLAIINDGSIDDLRRAILNAI